MRGTRIARAVSAAVLASAAAGGTASALPACAGAVEIGNAPVVRVERTDELLVLRDGRAVHLEGVRFPHAKQDHAPEFIADQAYDAIDTMARDRTLVVTAIAPKEDRYGRIRGQVFDPAGGDLWLQVALLKAGDVRVEIAPDRTDCAAELYAAEAGARAAHLGLWAQPAYAIRGPQSLGGDTGTFQIVQGTVLSAAVKDGRAYLDFGTDWKSDFTVTISPDDMANFRHDGVDPRLYAGKTVRVRGIVQQYDGPEIEIADPKQVEVLP